MVPQRSSGRLLFHGILLLLWSQWSVSVVSQPLTVESSIGLDPTTTTTPAPSSVSQTNEEKEQQQRMNVTIPLAVYILEGDDKDLSSDRTEEEIVQLIGRVNEIWMQANIELKLVQLQKVTIPNDILWR